ncbi:hypothetical protein N7456_005275 [Penicillium angulare]|uniref:Uncharacterized protein n=1 Tax=Penicillium angulare TaxID=116970 RepID=A0A9W9KJF4_9EURO|nr:hypothetical protein N7456_005275 [Penicillium angulare]
MCADNELDSFRSKFTQLLQGPEPFVVQELGDVMIEAVEQDNVEFASELLRHGYRIDGADFSREAVLRKSKGVLDAFLKAGWDVNELAIDKATPVLCYAVYDEDLTGWLLDRGANPNQRCDIICTPLSFAVQMAPMGVVELMLDRGGDVQQGQLIPYSIYREEGVIDMISFLVKLGAPLNVPMCNDMYTLCRFFFNNLGTALHIAAELGKLDVIRHLISLGADPSVVDYKKRTVLKYSKDENLTNVVELLEMLGVQE